MSKRSYGPPLHFESPIPPSGRPCSDEVLERMVERICRLVDLLCLDIIDRVEYRVLRDEVIVNCASEWREAR